MLYTQYGTPITVTASAIDSDGIETVTFAFEDGGEVSSYPIDHLRAGGGFEEILKAIRETRTALEIPLETWARGAGTDLSEDPALLYDKSTGNLCAGGHYLSFCGVSLEDMKDHISPLGVGDAVPETASWIVELRNDPQGRNHPFHRMAGANDKDDLGYHDPQRMSDIGDIFMENGVACVFTRAGMIIHANALATQE